MKTAAIVPALNEEANIGRVLEVLLKSKDLDDVIVVDGGSTDNTAGIASKMGAKVVRVEKCKGKAEAMSIGAKNTDAEVLVFFDADLIGLTQEHISLLVKPVKEGKAAMCTGVRERWLGLPELIIKIDPLLAIGGERAVRRFFFEKLPPEFLRGFMVETGLNYYCRVNKLAISYAILRGLDIIIKEKKWGFWRGLRNRLKMIGEIIKVRFLILAKRREFKDVQKDYS